MDQHHGPWSGTLAEARFKALDDAWLEREYSPSSAIGGNYEPHVKGWAERSAAVREALTSTSMLGVRYGKAIRNIIDVFPAPSTDGSCAPSLMFFHGGYWQESSSRDLSFPAAALNAAGITYISVEYTLAPKATLTQIVDEARQAVRFVVDNAAQFAVDPARLVVGGHSAGAHLAALSFDAALTIGETANEVGRPAPGLLLISGIYELLPLLRTSINDAIAIQQDDLELLSPLRHHPGCTRAAIVWGENETSEFVWQSQKLHASLTTVRPTGSFAAIEVGDRNHFDVIFDLADRASETFGSLIRLVGK